MGEPTKQQNKAAGLHPMLAKPIRIEVQYDPATDGVAVMGDVLDKMQAISVLNMAINAVIHHKPIMVPVKPEVAVPSKDPILGVH